MLSTLDGADDGPLKQLNLGELSVHSSAIQGEDSVWSTASLRPRASVDAVPDSGRGSRRYGLGGCVSEWVGGVAAVNACTTVFPCFRACFNFSGRVAPAPGRVEVVCPVVCDDGA